MRLAPLLLLALLAPAEADEISLGVRPGALGLFNLDQEFTPSDPSLGLEPAYTHAINDKLHVGAVCALSWVRSEVGTRHRLIVDPALRLNGRLPVAARIDAEAVLDVGAAFWPKDDSEDTLHPALDADRWGWSVHASGGVAYRWGASASFLRLGYAASTSYGRGLSATSDHALLTLGHRLTL